MSRNKEESCFWNCSSPTTGDHHIGIFFFDGGFRSQIIFFTSGDTIFFGATGFVKNEVALLVVRFFAGLCTPLVTTIAWTLDTAGRDHQKQAKYLRAFFK